MLKPSRAGPRYYDEFSANPARKRREHLFDLTANGDGSLNVYYAGADKYMCLATAKTQDLIDLCLEKRR